MPPANGTSSKIGDAEQAGAQSVIDVMSVVGDIVGDGCDLCLGAGKAPELQILLLLIIADGARHAAIAITLDRRCRRGR